MANSIRASIGLALIAVAGFAHAQSVPTGSCPVLPADSGLTWEFKSAGGTDFCRALRADGSEAFGMYMAASSAFKPGRSDRAEQATIDGRSTVWYRSEIAGQPNVEARETVITLPNGRVAYLWIHAQSQDELSRSIAQASTLHFASGAQLSSK